MGLDGIFANQFRTDTEVVFTQVEHNKPIVKPIDSAAKGKTIDPDDHNEKFNDQEAEEKKNKEDEESDINLEDITKYDLSDTKKFTLKVDDSSNNVLIINNETQEVIQAFSADVLSKLTGFLTNDNGILVNRKF